MRSGPSDTTRSGRAPPAASRACLTVGLQQPRRELLDEALRLSYFTVGWNCVTGLAAMAAAIVAGSSALAAFALSALLDSSASVVLVWRFRTERRDPDAAEHLERRAGRWVATAMVAVGLYVLVQAVRALVDSSHAEKSVFGAVLAIVALVVLPWLGRRKLRVASALGSGALRGDGVLTSAAASLAVVTLVALIVNSTLGWWWADPSAALLIGAALTAEGLRVAVRHRFG